MLPQATLDAARDLLAALEARGMTLSTAESCTGGLIAAALTAVPGSSAVVTRGYVTYSNDAKHEMLGVSAATLERAGAVSEATVREMAEGALDNSAAQVSLAVSGIAGPGGGGKSSVSQELVSRCPCSRLVQSHVRSCSRIVLLHVLSYSAPSTLVEVGDPVHKSWY